MSKLCELSMPAECSSVPYDASVFGRPDGPGMQDSLQAKLLLGLPIEHYWLKNFAMLWMQLHLVDTNCKYKQVWNIRHRVLAKKSTRRDMGRRQSVVWFSPSPVAPSLHDSINVSKALSCAIEHGLPGGVGILLPSIRLLCHAAVCAGIPA